MRQMAIVLGMVLALAPLAVFAGTLTVGEKVKLETGFGQAYTDDLASVTYSYTYDPAYLALDASSLAAAAEAYETHDGGLITGYYAGTARDGIVAAPVFEAIAATPEMDGVQAGTNITVNSVTAVNSKGKAIAINVETPSEPLVIVPEPEQPAVVWLFRWAPIAD